MPEGLGARVWVATVGRARAMTKVRAKARGRDRGIARTKNKVRAKARVSGASGRVEGMPWSEERCQIHIPTP